MFDERYKNGKKAIAYLETGNKICSNCNEEKPVSAFFKRADKSIKDRGVVRYRSKCKECTHLSKESKDKFEESRAEYRNKKKEASKKYRRWSKLTYNDSNERDRTDEKRYPRSKIAQRESALKKNYGLTINDFDNMAKKQEYKCYICQKETKKLCVDHCHNTGKVRKLLCDNCNKSLGLLKENKETLENMIKYLNEHPKTCGFCEKPCENSWCPTNTKEEE